MMLFSLALAAPPAQGWPELISVTEDSRPLFTVDTLNKLAVLDVNATHGALKLVHTLEPSEEMETEAVDCGYAGMKAFPHAGVELLVVELASGKTERFTVYKAAMEPSECMKHEASAEVLQKAKDRMKAVGLDPERKPAPLSGELKRPWGPVAITATTEKVESDPMFHEMVWTVKAGSRALFASKVGYTLIMAGSGSIQPAAFYEVPGGVVALQHVTRFDGRSGGSSSVGLSPLLKIP